MTNRILTNLRRRLERAELDLLRTLVTELATRVDNLEAELAQTYTELAWASQRADMFHDMLNEAVDQIPDAHIGMSQSGEVGLTQTLGPAH